MSSRKQPIILQGQVYFDDPKNLYLVVTKRQGEMISYSGNGFKGILEDEEFIERFQPVDPVDLSADETEELLTLCPPGVSLKIGFIKE